MWRGRSLWRTLADTAVFLALLAMMLAAGRQAGWFSPESGRYTVIDGDSLRKGGAEYRLHAIDAPELHQSCRTAAGRDYPCGREAADMLRRLVAGKTLSCSVTGTDRYGRLVAVCRTGSLDINEEMVRLGWAIAYVSHGRDYVEAEAQARAASRGIWQGAFESSESWRRAQRGTMVRGSLDGTATPPD